MSEESPQEPTEGGTAVAEGSEPESPESGEAGPQPVSIPRDRLAPPSEEDDAPAEEVAYKLSSEERKPQAVTVLHFEVAASDFEKELARYYENIRKDVTLPGFRKGKAPVKLIRIRTGEEGDREAMSDTAVSVLRREVAKREVELLADPQIVKWKIEDGQPLEIEIEIEVQPPIELKEYKGLEVEVETQAPNDAAVDGELERMRQGQAKQESADKKKKFEPGDTLVVDLKVLGRDGEELKHMGRENWSLYDYAQQLPPELADQVEGKKQGDEITAEITNTKKNRRGEELKFTDTYRLTINEIKVTKLPELDDDFAKDLGEHDTLAELREGVRKQLEERAAEATKQASIQNILEAIVEKNPVEAPRCMIAAMQYEAVMRDTVQLRQFGMQLGDVVEDPQKYMADQQQSAEARVKAGLLRAELVKVENLEVSDDDIEQEIARLAEEAGRKPLAIRAQLEANNQLDGLRDELMSRRVNDFLLENNTVKEVAAKPPQAEGEEAEAKAEKKAKPKKASTKAKPKAKADTEAKKAPAAAKKKSAKPKKAAPQKAAKKSAKKKAN